MASLAELEAAAKTVESAPHSTAAWDEVEGLAGDLDRPDDVIALYRRVLAKDDLGADVLEMIGERAAAFCDEWFGDDPKVAEGLLQKVIDRAPQAEQVLQRLSVLYTSSERWPELFALYDRSLAAIKDRGRQIKLLREASQLAKDVANQPDKAIGYLQRLLPLTPDDAQLGQGLERLLERHERWADLIALWEGRLESQSRKDREKTRARIAACYLDSLRDPAHALSAVRPLLGEAEDDAEACKLLERIIESPHTTKHVREGALDLLRAHYDSTSRPREVIRVLERVIAIDPAGSQALREEAGARLAELDDDGAAMDQYAALLAHTPDSSVTQEKLRQLAQRSNNYARYAEGVAAAAAGATTVARRVELLAEAARTRVDLLADPDGASALYQRALGEDGIGEKEQLLVCRRLADLYGRTERQRERLDILERLGAFDHRQAQRSGVLARVIVLRHRVIAGRPCAGKAAVAERRIFGGGGHPAGVIEIADMRDDHAVTADVQRLLDRDRLGPENLGMDLGAQRADQRHQLVGGIEVEIAVLDVQHEAAAAEAEGDLDKLLVRRRQPDGVGREFRHRHPPFRSFPASTGCRPGPEGSRPFPAVRSSRLPPPGPSARPRSAHRAATAGSPRRRNRRQEWRRPASPRHRRPTPAR